MNKILVPMAVFDENNYFKTHGVRTSYIDKILTYGLEPIFLSPTSPMDLIIKLYKQCDGVLLMGGGDINPSYYNKTPEPRTKIDDKNRDEVEIFLARNCISDKKPLLGICRGLQVINVAQGGSITQHLPDKFPNENHGISEGGNYSDLRKINCAHTIMIESNSNLYNIINKLKVTVACGHHQCIDKVGTELKIGAMSPAGVVESIEYIDPNYFCLGVQFHPEVYDNGELEPIFKAFFTSVKNRIQR